MRINILSTGRFHVCDLARELAACGHEVSFYSYVPRSRTRQFGLPESCARPILGWVFIPLALSRLFSNTFLENLSLDFLTWWMDRVVLLLMKPCDVVIAMSGCFNRSVQQARQKWGSKIFIERGSRHILSQKGILEDLKGLNPKTKTVSDSTIYRELKDYEIADILVVPSHHVVRSFKEKRIPEEKLFRNPYGVDITRFVATNSPNSDPILLMTGTWCLRKGCDLLEKAVRETGYRLLHAGAIGDIPFPKDKNFIDLGFMDQVQLSSVYAQAHVFVLPSREEGLSLVLAQALACGLCLVCSDRTGGEDLAEYLEDKNLVTVVKTGDLNDLRAGIVKAVKYAMNRISHRKLPLTSLEKISWEAYGNRYNRFLLSAMSLKKA